MFFWLNLELNFTGQAWGIQSSGIKVVKWLREMKGEVYQYAVYQWPENPCWAVAWTDLASCLGIYPPFEGETGVTAVSPAAFCLQELAKRKGNIPTLTIKPAQMLQYSDQRSTEIWNIYSGLRHTSYVHIYKWQLTLSEKERYTEFEHMKISKRL